MAEHETITVKKSTMRNLTMVVVVLLVAVSFAGGYIIGGAGKVASGTLQAAGGTVVQQPTQQAPQQQQQVPAGRVQVSADDDPFLGDANAKVTIIEFSDFQCPFCSRFFTQAEQQIINDYVKTGKAKFVYRDFPLDSIHPQANPAANAAECAKEQSKFWEYHDKIFQNQASLSDASYKQWAKEVGMNEQQFSGCYDTKKYDAEVQKDFQDGVAAGVSGTPTIFIGSDAKGYVKIVGAQPYTAIKPTIEAELNG